MNFFDWFKSMINQQPQGKPILLVIRQRKPCHHWWIARLYWGDRRDRLNNYGLSKN